jgi:lipopolysaccharide/colanic/teichoic acid biosynthesis glycosyltransferase
MPGELGKMNGIERVILQNRPGITGLWQVSGRNDLSFHERLEIDVHYVHNWTPWLDMYILARTLPVVLRGEGAA